MRNLQFKCQHDQGRARGSFNDVWAGQTKGKQLFSHLTTAIVELISSMNDSRGLASWKLYNEHFTDSFNFWFSSNVELFHWIFGFSFVLQRKNLSEIKISTKSSSLPKGILLPTLRKLIFNEKLLSQRAPAITSGKYFLVFLVATPKFLPPRGL